MRKLFWILYGYIFLGVFWILYALAYKPSIIFGLAVWIFIARFTERRVIPYILRQISKDLEVKIKRNKEILKKVK